MNASSGLGIPFPLTIGQRLLAMVVIFILALGAILAFTHTAVKSLEHDVVVMDVAGRQRMMIQRHLKDITQRKHQEIELANKTRELAQSNAELQQFAYVASHDLQEPLRMVASYTQLLGKRYRGKLDRDADEFIGYAVDGATRMQRLIRDLLEYSRVGAERQSFEETDCELVFEQAMQNLSASVRERHAEVTHDPLPIVQASPTHLIQVFQNLIGNALKFQGDAPPKIHVGAKALPDGWEFSVRDNGVGMPGDQLDRIFAIFQRLHGQSEYPGTGIGLAICKRIVGKYGGQVWAESEPGQGSTFYFTLTTPQEVMKPMP